MGESVDIEVDDTEVGNLRRERIVGDFGAGAGDAAQQRAFTGVWFADEADIGDDFELERKASRFALFAAHSLRRPVD